MNAQQNVLNATGRALQAVKRAREAWPLWPHPAPAVVLVAGQAALAAADVDGTADAGYQAGLWDEAAVAWARVAQAADDKPKRGTARAAAAACFDAADALRAFNGPAALVDLAWQPGDHVRTPGGLCGVVSSVDEEGVWLEGWPRAAFHPGTLAPADAPV